MAKQQKLTAKQKQERIAQAQERERLAAEQKVKSARLKRVFIIIVCVILILGLSLPTMALVVMGGGK